MSCLRPVVISGGFDDWPASDKWTPEFFQLNYGSRSVEVDSQRWRLDELIDRIRVSTPERRAPYLGNELLTTPYLGALGLMLALFSVIDQS